MTRVANAVKRGKSRRSYAVDTGSTMLNTAKQFSDDITMRGSEETVRVASCSAMQATFNLVYSLKLGRILIDSIQQCVAMLPLSSR